MSGHSGGGNGKGDHDRPERFADLVPEDTLPIEGRDRQHSPGLASKPVARRKIPQPEAPRFELEADGSGGRASGVSLNEFAKLRRGDLPVEQRIQLHGHTAESAKRVFERQIGQALSSGKRCVLVVHGRGLHSPGDPVLRGELPGWITQGALATKVLAFAHAPQRLGGSGATLVWLRRQR